MKLRLFKDGKPTDIVAQDEADALAKIARISPNSPGDWSYEKFDVNHSDLFSPLAERKEKQHE